MVKRISYLMTVASLMLLVGLSVTANAQRPYRVNDRQVEQLLTRLETRSDTFHRTLDAALDRSSYNGTQREDEINRYVSDFEAATDRLRDRFRNRSAVAADVEDVLNRGWAIDNFMRNNRLPQADRNWNFLRSDLRTLARYYNVAWQWDTAGYYPPGYGNVGDFLTGTYTLNNSLGDNINNTIDRAVRGLSSTDAQRVRRLLERRLDSPERIAISQNGRNITIASTTARQVSFDADGRTQTETRPNGRQVNTTVTMSGNRLTISSLGDRGSDYTVTFEPTYNGRRLQVTRQVFSDRLSQPVIVRSIYERTSEIAQLDLPRERRNRGNDRYRDRRNNRDRGSFGISDGTRLTAILNTDLSTETANEGDPFTMTVRSPSQYDGAIIEGYVSQVDRSGRFTGSSELVLDFERIRMRDGRTYSFTGYIDRIRTVGGDEVEIDNEGRVQEDDSQTGRTVRNTGIGAAVGAILGGILGGGKGAAIGAIVGGSAGAGSVVLQGRDDLKLMRGAEFTITAASPRYDAASRR